MQTSPFSQYAMMPEFKNASIVLLSQYGDFQNEVHVFESCGLFYHIDSRDKYLSSAFRSAGLRFHRPSELAEMLYNLANEMNTSVAIYDIAYLLEYDLDGVKELLEKFSELSKGSTKLVLNGNLPRSLVAPLFKIGAVFVAWDENTPGGKLYSQETLHLHHLEVKMFGPLKVWIDGHEVSKLNGALTKNLFCFLVMKQLAMREDIFANFWSHLDTLQAAQVFHVTKRKIAILLANNAGKRHHSEVSEFDFISHVRGDVSYALNEAKVVIHCDYHASQELLKLVDETQVYGERIEILEKVWKLAQLPLLEDLDVPWAMSARMSIVAKMSAEFADVGLHFFKFNSSKLAALNFLSHSFNLTPIREDVAQKLMTLYGETNDLHSLVFTYHDHEEALGKIGQSPSQETKDVLSKYIPNTI